MLADLYSVIREVAAAEYDVGNNDAGVVTILNTKSINFRDDSLRDAGWIRAQFNKTNSATVLEAYRASTDVNIIADYSALLGKGINLAETEVRSNITDLAVGVNGQPAWANSLKNNLLDAGRWKVAPAFNRIGRDATLQDITDVRAWFAQTENVRILSQRVSSAYNTVQAEINGLVITTESAARARFMELLSA